MLLGSVVCCTRSSAVKVTSSQTTLLQWTTTRVNMSKKVTGILRNSVLGRPTYWKCLVCAHPVHISISIYTYLYKSLSTCHHCELSFVFTSSYKCDSSIECGSIKHSIAPHSVAIDWRELQQIALWVIHLWHACVHHKMQIKTSSTCRQCITNYQPHVQE